MTPSVVRSWIPALAWGLFILLITLMPARAVPEGGFLGEYHIDKAIHAFLFGALMVLVARARTLGLKTAMLSTKALVLSAILVLAYGAFTEILQELMPFGRHGDGWDLLADGVGVLVAMVYLSRSSARPIY